MELPRRHGKTLERQKGKRGNTGSNRKIFFAPAARLGCSFIFICARCMMRGSASHLNIALPMLFYSDIPRFLTIPRFSVGKSAEKQTLSATMYSDALCRSRGMSVQINVRVWALVRPGGGNRDLMSGMEPPKKTALAEPSKKNNNGAAAPIS